MRKLLVNHGEPIYLMKDEQIREIRAWRGKVRQLKLYRAKGFCEICRQPFGVRSRHLNGHHITPPSKYQGEDSNSDDNIVICCDRCYEKRVLTGDRKWVGSWALEDRPREPVTSLYVYRRRLQDALTKKERLPRGHRLHWIGKRLVFKKYAVIIGISWIRKEAIETFQNKEGGKG